jgi:hypothetical protein
MVRALCQTLERQTVYYPLADSRIALAARTSAADAALAYANALAAHSAAVRHGASRLACIDALARVVAARVALADACEAIAAQTDAADHCGPAPLSFAAAVRH